MKRIAICADDYAMTPEVSGAILALAEQGSIQATSCMVTSRYWQGDADRLKDQQGNIDIGLHLNFTEGNGLSTPYKSGYPGLNKILVMSQFRLLNRAHLLKEIHAQFDGFIDTMGRAPDFIDGHQHVHHLPQIRDALLEVMKEKAKPTTWVRSVTPLINPVKSLKARVIEGSGAATLRQQLNNAKYATNSTFAGVYSLSEEEPFRPLMKAWLNALSDKSLIMCHPGSIDNNLPKSQQPDHADARRMELDYLSSQAFKDDCLEAKAKLVPLSKILSGSVR